MLSKEGALLMKNCVVLDAFDCFFNFIGIKKPLYKLDNFPPDLPAEKFSSILFGLFVHTFPALSFILLVQLSSFSLLGICSAFIGISLITLGLINWSEIKYPSVALVPLTMKDWI